MLHPKYKRAIPGQKTPDLALDTIQGHSFDIAEQKPENFTMLVFYRGLHCTNCQANLKSLEKFYDDFIKRGVEPIAISMDSRDRAERSKKEWHLEKLDIAYELTENMAAQWGLFLSKGRKELNEPELFSEPGLFLLRPDQTLYGVEIQSMPFARPHYEDILKAIDYILEHDYPVHGQYLTEDSRKKAA